MHPAPVVRRSVDRRRGVLPRRRQIAEAEQRLRHLDVDEARLDIAGLVGFVSAPDAFGGLLGTPDAGQGARAVAEVCVRLRLHRVQVGGKRRGDLPAGGPQRGLREGDGLAELPHEQRLVDQQRDDVRAKSPVVAGLCQPQGLVEVALGESVRVGVVGADARDGHQPAGGPVQLAACGVGVAAAQQGCGLGVEEANDAGAGRDATGLAVHLLVMGAGRAQHLDVGHAHPVPAAARDVHVVRRVLPLPHGHHRGRAGDRGGAEDVRALLLVGAPQGGGPLDEAGQGGAVRGWPARRGRPGRCRRG